MGRHPTICGGKRRSLGLEFATAAAQDIRPCQKYFTLVKDCSHKYYATTGRTPVWLAFRVQPASKIPLPDTYLPIWPCQLGTREPLRPGFDWPFGDCVVSTSDPVLFLPSLVDSDMGRNPHVLPPRDSHRFADLSQADRGACIGPRFAEEKARKWREPEAAGFSSEWGSTWTSFSPAALFRQFSRVIFFDQWSPSRPWLATTSLPT
ncbi:hypothetical protein B0H13DRAFT_1205861 [Mycena leptocephala]|nr:hypothetical protein B0H13DRAFT_1205861 [Mycena leptocephala]